MTSYDEVNRSLKIYYRIQYFKMGISIFERYKSNKEKLLIHELSKILRKIEREIILLEKKVEKF